MTEDTTYNGWTNYPTWCVNLWISNDESMYNDWSRIVEECQGRVDQTRAALKEYIEYIEEVIDEQYEISGFGSDLMSWALEHVNWNELTEHWIADHEFEEDDEEEDEEEDVEN